MNQAFQVLKQIVNWVYGINPALDSLAGYLNPVELLRVVLTMSGHAHGVIGRVLLDRRSDVASSGSALDPQPNGERSNHREWQFYL